MLSGEKAERGDTWRAVASRVGLGEAVPPPKPAYPGVLFDNLL